MKNKGKTVALHNLGCKVNAYETEGMQQILEHNGFIIVPFDAKADIYIVNTCSVTNIADHKSRQMLHRAKKMNPDAVVIACGCYVQTGRETLIKDPDVDIIIGNNEKANIVSAINEHFEKQGFTELVRDMNEHLPYEEMKLGSFGSRTRGFVKIQDGCNRFCTYCVIPYARGRVRSRQISDIISEVTSLVQNGCAEIVLTGIHISSFGTDRGSEELLELLKSLNETEGLLRIRLGSLEPAYVTDEWVRGAAGIEKLCPHFHLSLQSGSESVLKRMNRHYTPDEYHESVLRLRDEFDHPAITTDVIVGFPQETEEEFEESRAFVEKIGFYELHVFKYSRRDGTIAASLPGQITEKVKNERSAALIALGDKMSEEYRRSRIGTVSTIIPEEYRKVGDKEYLCGFTPEYVCAAIDESGSGRIKSDGAYAPVSGTIAEMLSSEVVLLKPEEL